MDSERKRYIKQVANFITNTGNMLQRRYKTPLSELVSPGEVAAASLMVIAGLITKRHGRELLEELAEIRAEKPIICGRCKFVGLCQERKWRSAIECEIYVQWK